MKRILLLGAIALASSSSARAESSHGLGLLMESSVATRALGGDGGTGGSVGLVWAPRSAGAWAEFGFSNLSGPRIYYYPSILPSGTVRTMSLNRRLGRPGVKDFSAGVILRLPKPGAKPFARIGIGWFHQGGVEPSPGPPVGRTLPAEGVLLSITPSDWGPGASLGLGVDGGVRSPVSPVIEIRGQTTRLYDIGHNLILSFHAGIWFR